MSEKKIKIEISKLTFVFVVLFSLCILVWTFIIGIWIGTKMGGKSEEKIVENYPLIQEQPSVQPPKEETPPEASKAPEVQPPQPATQEKPSEVVVQKPTEKKEEEVPIKKKEVAEIANKIKQSKDVVPPASYYALQIGSFSKLSSAEKVKALAEKKGYYSFIKKAKVRKKIVYRVYVGKFKTRAEAQAEVGNVAKLFGVKKPLLVEFR